MVTRLVSIALVAVFAAVVGSAPALHAQQSIEADTLRVQSLIADTKYTAVKANSVQPVWTISKHGENLGDFRVIVTTQKGLLVTFVTVAKKVNIRRTAELDRAMLKMTYDLDSVKVGFDSDEDAYVRIDATLRVVDPTEFRTIVEQVTNVSEQLGGVLKPYLTR